MDEGPAPARYGPKMLGGRVSSGSAGPAGGKGYSKRGGERSKGVPTMDEGECRLRFARLRWGFSPGVCAASAAG